MYMAILCRRTRKKTQARDESGLKFYASSAKWYIEDCECRG